MAEHSDMLCSKQFWMELWADIKKSWKCVVFGHAVSYRVLTTNGRRFVEIGACKVCHQPGKELI